MSDPLKENEALESELIDELCIVFERMLRAQSTRPRPVLEKYGRARVTLALVKARRMEAERCDAYGKIGSPRVLELKAAENRLTLEVAKLGLA